MKNTDPTLLASAPTLEDINTAITKFYAGSSKTLIPTSDDTWKIVNTSNDKELFGIRVRLFRRRYRLEMTAA